MKEHKEQRGANSKIKTEKAKEPSEKDRTMRRGQERERYGNEDMLQRRWRKRVGERISHGYKSMLRSSKVKRERKRERGKKYCLYR